LSLRYLITSSHSQSFFFWKALMKSSSDVVKCTVRDGAVLMHLGDGPVHIPSHLLNSSQVLQDALLSLDDSSGTGDFTLPAPQDWLQAWMACYGSEEERLSSVDIQDLVNCLLVRFCLCSASLLVLNAA
jgi:hypothetical protein